ncbi:MAG: sulfatase-like hydrolase/transferase, partial [Candidatus Hydrogenedentes bacterium]|nr:sulfatase-like hydrolase/transferase [Candidatus Hydrogenedentota bacterium]
LITVDALRRDCVALYSGKSGSPASFGPLARDGVRFTGAYSPSPWTYPSMTSMLTGLTPAVAGTVSSDVSLPEAVDTLAERLSKAGIVCGAFVNNPFLATAFGLGQGFGTYDHFPKPPCADARIFGGAVARRTILRDVAPQGDAAMLTDRALRWIAAHRGVSFFLWIHYFDPHTPYCPPPESLEPSPLVERWGPCFTNKIDVLHNRWGTQPDEQAWIRLLYEAEVRYADAQVCRLLKGLQEMGLYDDALIIGTTDHGEELWDHGGFEHGHTLYNELIRLPLIVKRENEPRPGAVIEQAVLTAGATPTILDHFSVSHDPGALSVPGWSALLAGAPDDSATQRLPSGYPHSGPECAAVIAGDWKYIAFPGTGEELLFALEADPYERISLTDERPEVLGEMRRALADLQAGEAAMRQSLGFVRPEEADIPPAVREELEALGYL